MKPEKPVEPALGSWAHADVIVPHRKICIRLIDPNHSASRIIDQIVVKQGRTFRRSITKSRNQIAMIFGWIEIKQVVINLHTIAHKFNGVAILE